MLKQTLQTCLEEGLAYKNLLASVATMLNTASNGKNMVVKCGIGKEGTDVDVIKNPTFVVVYDYIIVKGQGWHDANIVRALRADDIIIWE